LSHLLNSHLGEIGGQQNVCRTLQHRVRCDPEVVSSICVGPGNSVVDGHCRTVLATHDEAVWSELVVVLVECVIDGTVVCAVKDALSLFFFLLLNKDVINIIAKMRAVAGNKI
jgi:hypothetical protein